MKQKYGEFMRRSIISIFFIITFTSVNALYAGDQIFSPTHQIGTDSISKQSIGTVRTVIKDDFLVNDDTSGGSSQESCSIGMDSIGNFVITWMDGKNEGSCDIYCRRYNSAGNALGDSFRVNDDAGCNMQYNPSIAVNGSGDFVISWQDYRNGSYDVYCQRYQSAGTAQGSNLKVNDTESLGWKVYPSVAIDDSGNFVIAWSDERNGNTDIFHQRYDSLGKPIGSNIEVNDNIDASNQEFSSIAMTGSGNYVIAWQDFRSTDPGIYSQRYNSSGVAQGANFIITSGGGGQVSISMNDTGNFVIVWEDNRSAPTDIYCRRYDSAGTAIGSDFIVNDVPTQTQRCPSVTISDPGNYVITWFDNRNGDWDIYCQRYDSVGNTQSCNIKVDDASSGDSIAMWAVLNIVPPGVSYTPRDFMPMKRFSTISVLPMP